MTQRTLSPRAWAELLLLSAVWGGSFLSIRVALDEIGPLTVVAHRVGWASLALWLAIAAMRLPVPRGARVWGAFAVMGLLNNLIPFGLMAWGQLHIPTGLTSILNAATAVWGVIVASLLFADERLTPRRAAGVALGFAGVVTAIGWRALAELDVRSLAQLAVLAGTVSYAFAGAWARVALGGLRPEVAAAGMLTTSTLVAIPLAWAVEGRPVARARARHLGRHRLLRAGRDGVRLPALLPRAGQRGERQPPALHALDRARGHRARRPRARRGAPPRGLCRLRPAGRGAHGARRPRSAPTARD